MNLVFLRKTQALEQREEAIAETTDDMMRLCHGVGPRYGYGSPILNVYLIQTDVQSPVQVYSKTVQLDTLGQSDSLFYESFT